MIYKILLFIFALFGKYQISIACAANGICPTPGLCYPYAGYSQPSCGTCHRAYSCGTYGCYRTRARASLNFEPDTLRNPNTAFLSCCMDRKLPDACLEKCNFGRYNKNTLTEMYFKRDLCPIAALSELQFCAARGKDHRACCIRNGVTTTLAGSKCLIFCDQTPGKITPLDMSYVSCFDRFENMKSCFWHDLARFYTK
uniref:DB domain-containing protein n=1 Tax=Strongyloides stercoralis TaxID=6248 RepID=A0AAF5DF37_STRER